MLTERNKLIRAPTVVNKHTALYVYIIHSNLLRGYSEFIFLQYIITHQRLYQDNEFPRKPMKVF